MILSIRKLVESFTANLPVEFALGLVSHDGMGINLWSPLRTKALRKCTFSVDRGLRCVTSVKHALDNDDNPGVSTVSWSWH